MLPNGSGKLADRQLIVIMLGGACHAEVRCMARSPRRGAARHLEVVFGTTALLTPNAHLKALRRVPALPLLTPLGTLAAWRAVPRPSATCRPQPSRIRLDGIRFIE